jgi:hypothetical protein
MRANHYITLFTSFVLALAWGCGDDGGGGGNADASVNGIDAANGNIDAAVNPPDADVTPDAVVVDATPPPDAQPGAFDCLGLPLPPAEGPTVTISGQAFTVGFAGQTPVQGAVVTGFLFGDTTNPLATDTTDANGDYSITSNTTGGMPLDAYLQITEPAFLDSYLYPPTPVFQANLSGVATLLLDSQTLSLIATLAGATQTAGQGFSVVLVVDCFGNPVSGATVSSVPAAGDIRYTDGMLPSSTATATGADGLAFLFDLPPGPVEVDADALGMSLREHTLDIVGDAVTSTIVVP